MFRVIKKFADLDDKRYIYQVGDEYPREGYEPSEDRVEFLSSDQNKLGTPVIEFVQDVKEDSEKEPVAKKTKNKSK